MTRTKKLLIGSGVIVLLGMLVFGIGLAISPVSHTFAQEPTPQPTPGNPPQNSWSAYQDTFLNALATRLGKTIDQIKEAYSGAFTETLDQAVIDGKLTQTQADQEKQELATRMDQGMFPGFFGPPGFAHGRGHGEMGEPGGFGKRGGMNLSSFANALGMTEAELMTELQSGKTIAAIATEKGVNLEEVKTSVLNDMKANLDQAVKDGKITQTSADEMYSQFSTSLDTFVNQTWQNEKWFGPMGKDQGSFGMRGGRDLSPFATALNITEAELMTEVQSGKTIAAIATEKGVSLEEVKTSVLNEMKANLDQAVKDGKITRTAADEMYSQFSTNLDTFVNQTWQTGEPHPVF